MRCSLILAVSLLCLLSAQAELPAVDVDLRRIGPIAPKGRVQDRDYNPELPEVEKLIKAGPRAIPFLISKLEDQTIIKTHVIDYWGKCTVGDVAWAILCDFFTTPDWQKMTIEPNWSSLVEPNDQGARAAWDAVIKKHGRKGIRSKVETILKAYEGKLEWDPNDRCFRPSK